MSFPLPQLETSNIKISFFISSFLPLSPSLEFLKKYKIEINKDSPEIINFTVKLDIKKPYICNFCNISFDECYDFDKHLKRKHKQKDVVTLDETEVNKIRSELEETFGVETKKEYKSKYNGRCNIKISFTVKSFLPPCLEFLRKYKIKIYKDFSQLINVTGIRSLNEVHQIISELEEKFGVTINKKYRIDNIMASRKVKLIFDFKKIIDSIKMLGYDKVFHVDYDEETYSQRIFLKPRKKPFPSIQLLYTGSVTVMGCKSFHHVRFCQNVIKQCFSLNTLRRTKST